jgi:hypothetical protein
MGPELWHLLSRSVIFLTVLQFYLIVTSSSCVQGAKWELSGEDEPRVRFWGSSVDLHLNWTDVLTFSDGDTYSWRKVRCPQGACACLPHRLFSIWSDSLPGLEEHGVCAPQDKSTWIRLVVLQSCVEAVA